MNAYLEDVLKQSASLRNALAFYEAQDYQTKMKKIAGGGFDKVVFAGMGSSHYCNFGASIYLASHGINAEVKSGSELLHHAGKCIDGKTLLVLVSQSGESGEIVKFIDTLPPEMRVIAITNEAESTLGKRGDPTFLLHVDSEKSVSTRTYLASWILSAMLARALTKKLDDGFVREVNKALDLLDALVSTYADTVAKMKAFMPDQKYICYLGRGYSYSSVYGGSLFTSELAKYPSMGFDAGEFRHGPFEMVDERFGAVVFAPDGPFWDANCRMAQDIASHGGKAILVTNRSPSAMKNLMVVGYGAIDESFSPLVDIGAAELFANMIAESKGIEIGTFRWGSKVTTVI